MTSTHRWGGQGRRAGDEGLSMVVTAASLLVTAVLVLLALEATLGSSGGSGAGSVSGNPAVASADHVQAQQALSTALTDVSSATVSGASGLAGAADSAAAAATAEAEGGGSGSSSDAGSGQGSGVDIAQLHAADPSLTFVNGPTTVPSTVSVSSGTGPAGSVTLATRSSDGVCWVVWHAPTAQTWYGAQTGLASCTAPALAAAPSPGPVTSGAIGWQTGGFPAA